MPLIGITGGYATGKSLVSRMFVDFGAHLIDCDKLARDVVEPGSEGLKLVVEQFGESILRSDGSLDRNAIAKIVFHNSDKRKTLESILHPLILVMVKKLAEDEFKADPGALVVVEAALLFESGLNQKMEKNITIVCKPEQQIARAKARDNLSEDEIRARIAAHWPLKKKAGLADFVIENSGSAEETLVQVRTVREKILKDV